MEVFWVDVDRGGDAVYVGLSKIPFCMSGYIAQVSVVITKGSFGICASLCEKERRIRKGVGIYKDLAEGKDVHSGKGL